MKDTFTVVTVADRRPLEPYYCFGQFFKSLGDVEPLVLHNANMDTRYGGLGTKPKWLYKAIKSGMIDTKYLIFCDCFDLVFAQSPKQLFLKYLQFASPLVISAEKNCFPDTYKAEYDKLAEDIVIPYKYLNSGMIVGEVEAMLAVLEDIDAPNIPNDYWSQEKNCMINPNDQEYYQASFLRQPVPITLDRYQILCNTLHSVQKEELDFDGDYIFNKVTQTYPCSFHLNGGSKTGGLREPILEKLNLL